jgi:hypothetical protein
MKKWLYHDEHDPKLCDIPDAQGPQAHKLAELYEKGWRDSPAELPAKPGYRGSIPVHIEERHEEAAPVAIPSVMRAKLKITNVQPFDGGEVLTFAAVCAAMYGDDGIDEDNTFARFTPAADLNMTVQNPNLIGALPIDSVYYVDFTLAEAAPVKAPDPVQPVDGGTGEAPEDAGDDVIEPDEENDEADGEAAAMLVQFRTDPKSLNKDQYVQLGAALGLRLMKAWNEDTLINKINEALTNGDTEKAD